MERRPSNLPTTALISPPSGEHSKQNLEDAPSIGSVEDQSPSRDNLKQPMTCPEVRRHGSGTLDEVYSFLQFCKHGELRNMNKSWGMNVGGKKEVLVARAMLRILSIARKGQDIHDVLVKNQYVPSLDTFWENRRVKKDLVRTFPGKEELLKVLDERERRTVERMFCVSVKRRILQPEECKDAAQNNAKDGENTGTKQNCGKGNREGSIQFSLGEFARLMLVIRDDQVAKSAVLQATEEELSKRDMDIGRTRDSFWKIVEIRFNTAVITEGIDLSGRVDNVDATAPPLVPRNAAKLRAVYTDAKSDFTEAMARYNRSGQSDPGRFPKFLSYLQNGELSQESKRVYIIFSAAGVGSRTQNDDFIRLMSKSIDPNGSDTRGYEEGMDMNPSQYTPVSSPPSSSFWGKRRRSSDQASSSGMLHIFQNVVQDYSRLQRMKLDTASNNSHLSPTESATRERCSGVLSNAVEKEKLMELVKNAATTLETAKETSNQSFQDVAQEHYEDMLKKYKEFSK